MATKKAARKSGKKADDLLGMLKEDHERVQAMFEEFDSLDLEEDQETAQMLAEQACAELEIHAQIEEELFYPALRAQIEDTDLIDEAEVEHNSARDLIEQLKQLAPDDPKYVATFKVLGEYTNHHIEEEENELFKHAKKAKIDWAEVAEQARTRKEELMAEMGLAAEEDEPEQATKVRS